MFFQIFINIEGDYEWKLISKNGKNFTVLGVSADSYSTRLECFRALQDIRKNISEKTLISDAK